MQTLRFSREEKTDFFIVLRQRVDQYFKDNQISRYANGTMVVKTVFMIALYYVPYAWLLSGTAQGIWFWLAWALIGFGMAGIGMSIMHDANHQAYSANGRVNNLLGMLVNCVGGDAHNWKAQHNILHHTYTNIHHYDEDINDKIIMRFAPQGEHKPVQKHQYWYAFIFYSLMTLYWVTVKDFAQYKRYLKTGLLKETGSAQTRQWLKLIGWKVFYYVQILVIPMLVMPQPWWQIILGFLVLHAVAGLVLSLVFQLAHVVESTDFPEPDATGTIQNDWAIHQLETTANFAHKNPLLTFYVGGLNYQAIHHLFPKICHVHYPAIAPIVEATAKEYGVKYLYYPSFGEALTSHVRMLRKLGVPEFTHLMHEMG